MFDNTKVRNVSLHSCEIIDYSCFFQTKRLNKVEIPNIRWICSHAFYLSELKSIDITNVSLIEDYAFFHCDKCNFIGEVYPNLDNLGYCSFTQSAIKKMIANKLEEVSASAFEESKISYFEGNNVVYIQPYAFLNSYLDEIKVPMVSNLGDYSLSGTLIKDIEANNCICISEGVFEY